MRIVSYRQSWIPLPFSSKHRPQVPISHLSWKNEQIQKAPPYNSKWTKFRSCFLRLSGYPNWRYYRQRLLDHYFFACWWSSFVDDRKRMGKVVEWWCRQRAAEAEWRDSLERKDKSRISVDNLRDHDDGRVEGRVLDLKGNSFLRNLRGRAKVRCSYSDQRQLQREPWESAKQRDEVIPGW